MLTETSILVGGQSDQSRLMDTPTLHLASGQGEREKKEMRQKKSDLFLKVESCLLFNNNWPRVDRIDQGIEFARPKGSQRSIVRRHVLSETQTNSHDDSI